MASTMTNKYYLAKVMLNRQEIICEGVSESISQDTEKKPRLDSHEAHDRSYGLKEYEVKVSNIDMVHRNRLKKMQKEQDSSDDEVVIAIYDFKENGRPVEACRYTDCAIKNIDVEDVNKTLDVTFEPLHMMLP